MAVKPEPHDCYHEIQCLLGSDVAVDVFTNLHYVAIIRSTNFGGTMKTTIQLIALVAGVLVSQLCIAQAPDMGLLDNLESQARCWVKLRIP